MLLDEISGHVIASAMRVHTHLGPGLLESAYQACLRFELQELGLRVAVQVGLPVKYFDVNVEAGYRIDMLVEDQVVVELKAVDAIHPIHKAQLLSYLKLSEKRLGLIINFNVLHLKDGITRMVNGY